MTSHPIVLTTWRHGTSGASSYKSVEESKFVVESIEVGLFADVTVHLSNEMQIQSFGSSGQDIDLWWFRNLCSDVSCLVGPFGQNVGESVRGD